MRGGRAGVVGGGEDGVVAVVVVAAVGVGGEGAD
jgi:hypothetical protein